MFAAFVSAVPVLHQRHYASSAVTQRNTNFLACFSSRRSCISTKQSSSTLLCARHENSKHIIEQPNNNTLIQNNIQNIFSIARKALTVVAVTFALSVCTTPDIALAAKSGGRVGGSQFRSAPAPKRSAPSGGSAYYGGGGGGGYYGGYGYGYGYGLGPSIFVSPFVAPFGGFGLGLGGIGGLLALAAVASFVSDSLQRSSQNLDNSTSASTTTGIIVVKVGLLSTARSVQVDLEQLARSADTMTLQGLTSVLQSSATALLRCPDYWMYGSSKIRTVTDDISNAESQFNEAALSERLKVREETLSNSGGIQMETNAAKAKTQDLNQAPAEYVVVSFVVAADGQVVTQTPKVVDNEQDMRRALTTLASISNDGLQAVEIIWAPQSLRDTLTEREMLEDHPELKRL